MSECQFCNKVRKTMVEEFKAWLAQPFSADMSALEWSLFIGFLIVLIVFWNLVLAHVLEGAR
jgi:hypothetical protein